MAQALDQTPLLSWRGEDVGLKDVVEELHRLEGEQARAEAREPGEQPRARTSSMNMVAITSDEDGSNRAARVLDGLAVHHPSRSLILELGSPRSEGRIDAEVLIGGRELAQGFLLPFERILLKVSGEATDHIAALIEPFLMPDLPTHLWWLGDPPLQEQRFRDAVPSCATVLVDTGAFDRPYESFLAFADLVDWLPHRIGVEDLHWARLHPWREMLAQFFASPDTQPLLRSIRGIGIDYAGEGRGNRVVVALLVGWLAGALRWRIRRVIGGPDGRLLAELETLGGEAVEVGCQPKPAPGLQAGEVVAIRLHAAGAGAEGSMVAERDPQNPRNVNVRLDVGGKHVQQVFPMESQAEPDLLVRALMLAGRDAVYLRSLRLAAALMKALE